MKKVTIVLLINVVLIVIIIAKMSSYWESVYRVYTRGIRVAPEVNIEINTSDYDTEEPPKDLIIENTDEVYQKFCGEERIKFGEQYNKRPIVVLGCSYAYGHGLERNETFPYLLSEITKRPVFSYATCGSNILDNFTRLYDDLNSENGELIRNSEYFIYVYMHDHIIRYLEPTRFDINMFFDELFDYNPFEKLLSKVFLFKYIIIKLKIKEILNEYPKNEKSIAYLKHVIKISHERIKKIAPDSKFIILLYDEKLDAYYPPNDLKYHTDIQYSPFWKEFEKDGISVVYTKDLVGFKFDKNYKLRHDIADWHPNGKVWKLVTPPFVKNYIKS